MSTLDDLRHTLHRQAALAPDGAGLLDLAFEGAVRIRRRRRRVRVAAGAALLGVAVVGTPVLVQQQRSAQQPARHSYRTATQLTVEARPGSNATVVTQESLGTRQWVRLSAPTPDDPARTADVTADDPGTVDVSALRTGERRTVDGHDAWLRGDEGTVSYYGSDRLGWLDPSGAWVSVSMVGTVADERAALEQVATMVRLGPPREVQVPYRLGWLPPRLAVGRVRTGGTTPAQVSVQAHSRPDPADAAVALAITARPRTDPGWPGVRRSYGAERGTVAGHPAYQPAPADGWDDGPGARRLAVEIGTCGLQLDAADRSITVAELDRVVASMTVADCTDRATWTPVGP